VKTKITFWVLQRFALKIEPRKFDKRASRRDALLYIYVDALGDRKA
jgi:hypothetical protein